VSFPASCRGSPRPAVASAVPELDIQGLLEQLAAEEVDYILARRLCT
jgi:hypothetical protein